MGTEEILKLMKPNKVGSGTGYVVSIIVNTKKSKMPLYFGAWLLDLQKKWLRGFEVIEIYDVTSAIEHWRNQSSFIEVGDNLIQIALGINIEISEPEIDKYLATIIEKDLGCMIKTSGFRAIDIFTSFVVPSKLRSLATGGELSVMVMDRNPLRRMAISESVFGKNYTFSEMEIYMQRDGEVKYPNSLKKTDLKRLMEYLTSKNIKYKIELDDTIKKEI